MVLAPMTLRKPDKYLTRKERERFDAIAEAMTIKEAAEKLRLREGTLNNWTYKLRRRLVKERGHVNACLSQTKRTELLKKVLSIKTPIEIQEEEEEEKW